MSKSSKPYYTIHVETVENLEHCLSYSITTLKFWHKDKEWPTNLIYDCLNELLEKIHMIQDIQTIKNVSSGNIIDK